VANILIFVSWFAVIYLLILFHQKEYIGCVQKCYFGFRNLMARFNEEVDIISVVKTFGTSSSY